MAPPFGLRRESSGTKIKYKTIQDTVEVHDTVPVDTLSILEDYFATYAYTDTLKKDSVTFIINDTISQNKILSRGINYSLVYPTKIISTEREVNKRELYIGFGLGGDKQQLSYLGRGIGFEVPPGKSERVDFVCQIHPRNDLSRFHQLFDQRHF